MTVRVVSTAVARPWARQVALWRRARVVVGLHGGASPMRCSSGPARASWRSRRAGIRGHPSMFAHMAVGVGDLPWCSAECSMARGRGRGRRAVARRPRWRGAHLFSGRGCRPLAEPNSSVRVAYERTSHVDAGRAHAPRGAGDSDLSRLCPSRGANQRARRPISCSSTQSGRCCPPS